MVKFYVNKIKNKEINYITRQVWELKDVPILWKSKVEKELNKL